MKEKWSPKRVQRTGKFQEALRYYVKRYCESLEKGDRFLSALYLDEIAQTLVFMSEGKLSYETFNRKVREVISPELKERQFKGFEEDLEIVLRKRFPEIFERESQQHGFFI